MSADALAHVRALGCDVVLADAEHLKLLGPREARAQVRDLVIANKPALLAHLRGQTNVIPFILPAPDASALLGHCTRLRRNTAVSANDVQALAQHFETLGREAAITSERRLWAWWKATEHPTVAAFLALEPKEKGPSHA